MGGAGEEARGLGGLSFDFQVAVHATCEGNAVMRSIARVHVRVLRSTLPGTRREHGSAHPCARPTLMHEVGVSVLRAGCASAPARAAGDEGAGAEQPVLVPLRGGDPSGLTQPTHSRSQAMLALSCNCRPEQPSQPEPFATMQPMQQGSVLSLSLCTGAFMPGALAGLGGEYDS